MESNTYKEIIEYLKNDIETLKDNVEVIFDTWLELYKDNNVDTYDDDFKELVELHQEKKNTIKRLEDATHKDNTKMSAREFIKKQTGQREMYQSIAKLMNDNEDKLSSEEWKALDNARMILKQNPELIADDSILSDTSKPIHERLSKYMNDNEYKLDSGVWGPLYEANKVLRQNNSGEKTNLKDENLKISSKDNKIIIEKLEKGE